MGKGDKKSKRGKIIIGSYGVRRASRKRKASSLAATRAEKQPVEIAVIAGEPVDIPVAAVEPLKAEEKKVTRKTTARKAAEGDSEKPKASKTKKKTAPEGENLFDQPQEPAPEQ